MVVNGSLTLGELTSFYDVSGVDDLAVLALARMFNIVGGGAAPVHPRHAGGAPVVKDGEEPVPAGRGERRRPFVSFVIANDASGAGECELSS